MLFRTTAGGKTRWINTDHIAEIEERAEKPLLIRLVGSNESLDVVGDDKVRLIAWLERQQDRDLKATAKVGKVN